MLAPEVFRSPPRRRRILILAVVPFAMLTAHLIHKHQQRAEALSLVRAVAAHEWPRWHAAHARGECPTSIAELGGRARELDPWGHPLAFGCTKEFGEEFVVSAGPDGVAKTKDDIRSSD